MNANRSAPPGPVVPSLIYQDVAKAIDWLCGAFGFTERLRTAPEADGTIHHAQLAVGLGSVILTGQPAKRPEARMGAVLGAVLVAVKDIDAHCERARRFGAPILSAPDSKPFGERQYSAEDLEGHRWVFTESVGDVAPEAWGATAAHMVSPLARLPRPRLCYLEIPALDVQQSAAFYAKVMGWTIRHGDTNRPSFDDATGYVSGAWVAGRPIAREPGMLAYIWVDHIDQVLTQVLAHGGQVVDAPHADSPGGTCLIATFRDPAGNLVGLYQEET